MHVPRALNAVASDRATGFGPGARRAVFAMVLLASLPIASASAAAPRFELPSPRTAIAADSLATTVAPSAARLAAFREWSRVASLDDLMYVLRHTPVELNDLEGPAAEAALARTPAERGELRARLAARVALAAPRRGRRGSGPSAAADGAAGRSAFRVGLLLPSRGDHADEAADLEAGFRAGLASRATPGRPPIECLVARTGDDDAAEVAVAFDSLSPRVALVCGGFSRASAAVLAAGSRWSGLPALLPALDEPLTTRLSPTVWAVGPTAEERGRALAQAMKPGPADRIGVISSSAADTAFAGGFVAACRARGAVLAARFGYAPGNATFAAEVRALATQRVSILFWDGDPSEAAPLLRQLTHDRVSLRICGGNGFAPARHHRETRIFLEGVMFVPDDWTLAAGPGSEPHAAQEAARVAAAGPLAVRGWLAGRAAGAALATAPYTPAEVAAAIAHASPGAAGTLRMLDARGEGAELPVYVVSDGKAARTQ